MAGAPTLLKADATWSRHPEHQAVFDAVKSSLSTALSCFEAYSSLLPRLQ
ncbi:hypothetical protein L917_03654 [Phytophthora nicotianae]|uniref:Uncharacterized protein n=1 Tax=Phytophthora nicotianae TaxID=4792 RepID=W2LPZ7_PHYNI|nr:hypothetical protein L917_03654 [Phytophthora nicotianae]